MRPESPYRRPAQKRHPSDVVGAVLRLACIAMAAAGAGVAFAGLDDLRHGGGDAGRAVALVGLALLLWGAGAGVLVEGVRRG